ncbi:Rap1a/Tai family immunity protein [Sphingobium sp. CR2-8]|uniref:Rap1a/Tai family immunity protein n=1 Tax=Sphingobium sp. CR2-8 TaxID=1306534 RepID=UPI002DC02336|nr:Rap1a/Tai family immunity protein [Sphingobium sp. CR2-8]MEC3910908.1 Rap1a/Tai family immunity protein [Sphingobium sp. CR2-8]
MRPKHLSYFALAAAALIPATANAGFYSGDELYAVCTTDKDSKDYFEKSYECVGYISGAVDAFNTTREANKLKSCIPGDVTINKLRTVTVDYLGNNPIDRKQSASSQVFAATRKAWPCSTPKAAVKKKASRKKR